MADSTSGAFAHLYSCLVKIQEDRDLIPMDFHAGDRLPYWNDHEKIVMWREVNRFRRALERTLVCYRDIERAEQQASGHFDYTKKFALYCAELAVSNDSDNC